MTTRKQREEKQEKRTSAKEWANQQSQGFTPTAIKLPDGIQQYKLEEGTHQIDIMPFLAGEGNPRADEGIEHFEAEYMLHRIPRPDGNFDRYVCLAHDRFKKPCKLCAWRNDRNRSKEEADALRSQKRHLFLVQDKPGSKKNPLKILDAVYFNRKLGFGEQLVVAINATRGGGSFSSLTEGKTLQIMVADSKYGSVSRIDFVDRNYVYPEEMLKTAPCLDKCILQPTTAQLSAALGIMDEEDSDDGRNGSSHSTSRGVDVEDDDDDKPTPKAVGKKPSVEDDEEDEPSTDDSDLEPDDEGEAVPKKKVKGKPSKEKTATEMGFKVGMFVNHPEHGECQIKTISKDGTSLLLEDEDEETFPAIAPSECTKVPVADADDDDDPSDSEVEDEDDDDSDLGSDEEEEEEEEKPKPKRRGK